MQVDNMDFIKLILLSSAFCLLIGVSTGRVWIDVSNKTVNQGETLTISCVTDGNVLDIKLAHKRAGGDWEQFTEKCNGYDEKKYLPYVKREWCDCLDKVFSIVIPKCPLEAAGTWKCSHAWDTDNTTDVTVIPDPSMVQDSQMYLSPQSIASLQSDKSLHPDQQLGPTIPPIFEPDRPPGFCEEYCKRKNVHGCVNIKNCEFAVYCEKLCAGYPHGSHELSTCWFDCTTKYRK